MKRGQGSNTSAKTIEENNGSEGFQESEEEKNKKINLTVAVFFDGTGNNRYNTNARWQYLRRELGVPLSKRDNIRADRYERYKGGLGLNEGSYENDLSNIARLEKMYNTAKLSDTHWVSKIYINGVATKDGGADQLTVAKDGEGMGLGVMDKLNDAVREVRKVVGVTLASCEEIENLIINVYGFSRGAATARAFIHYITKPAYTRKGGPKGKKTIFKPKWSGIAEGRNVSNLKINFAGLFDSVSSYDKDGDDKGDHEHDDVEELHQKAVNKAKTIVHLIAGDEYRKNFAVTTVSKGLEKVLPGVHSDVGGCYRNDKEVILCLVAGRDAVIQKEKKKLDSEGWFKKEQLSRIYDPNGLWAALSPTSYFLKELNPNWRNYRLEGERLLYKNYSFIPLEIMAILSDNELGINITMDRLSEDYHIHSFDKSTSYNDIPDLNQEQKDALTYMRQRLIDYVIHDGEPVTFYTEEELQKRKGSLFYEQMKKDSAVLKVIRNCFLHISHDEMGTLSKKIGMESRFENGLEKEWCMRVRVLMLLNILLFTVSCDLFMEQEKKYEWTVSANGHELCPIDVFRGSLHYGEEYGAPVFSSSISNNGWGEANTIYGDRKPKEVPHQLDIIWLSLRDNKFYGGAF